MTTIAWDGFTLAGDKRTHDSTAFWETTKVFQSECGRYLIGGSGDAQDALLVRDWVFGGMDESKKPSISNYAGLLIIDGKPHFMDTKLIPLPIGGRPFYAVGSGRDFALAAMLLGKNAVEAILVAAEFDNYTGLGVDEIKYVEAQNDAA